MTSHDLKVRYDPHRETVTLITELATVTLTLQGFRELALFVKEKAGEDHPTAVC